MGKLVGRRGRAHCLAAWGWGAAQRRGGLPVFVRRPSELARRNHLKNAELERRGLEIEHGSMIMQVPCRGGRCSLVASGRVVDGAVRHCGVLGRLRRRQG